MNDNTLVIQYSLEEGGQAPFRKYQNDAGWDLFTSTRCYILPGQSADVHTGLHVQLPNNTYIRITGRSSTVRKHGLWVMEAIIDGDYTGELFITVWNKGDKPFVVEPGMRLAQAIVGVICPVRWHCVDKIEPLPGTRGDNGYGSTGV